MSYVKTNTLVATTCLVSMLALSVTLVKASEPVIGPWEILLDKKELGDWNYLGSSNWGVTGDVVVADKRDGKSPGYLVSQETYSDFVLHVEFWASDDANSGIFFRCPDSTKITDLTCYEANIFDQRPDPSYGTGAIVRHAEIDPMPKAGGKWNTYKITANGRDISLELNGQVTARLRSGLFTEGFFAIQHGAGTIKLRKVMIRSLN